MKGVPKGRRGWAGEQQTQDLTGAPFFVYLLSNLPVPALHDALLSLCSHDVTMVFYKFVGEVPILEDVVKGGNYFPCHAGHPGLLY